MGVSIEIGGQEPIREFEHLEAGTYPGRLVHIIELGQQPNTHPKAKFPTKPEIMLVFEVSELMQDGRPFTVNIRTTMSLNPKSKLFSLLSPWLPWLSTLLEEADKGQEGKTFEFGDLLDKTCMLSINYAKANSGKFYNNITGIFPLPKGMAVIERQNPLIEFSINQINLPIFDELWPYVQNIIKKSVEGKKYFGENAAPTPPKHSQDLPFTK